MTSSARKSLFEAISAANRMEVASLLNLEPALAQQENDMGITPIVWAAYHRQFEIAQTIASYCDKLLPFEMAVLGDVEGLQAAFEINPQIISQVSSDGFTLLHYGCFFGHFGLVKWLITKGSQLDANTPQKIRPIHSAVAAKATPIVQLLLASGADPNVKQLGGFTPLMSAAKHGELDIIAALLSHGARTTLKDDQGFTARDMALAEKQMAAVQLIDQNQDTS